MSNVCEDMVDNEVSPKSVDPNLRRRRKPVSTMAFGTDPSLRGRRKPVTAVAFGMYPSDLRKTLPFITTKDRAWCTIACYYLDNAVPQTSLCLDSRVAWEADLISPLALGQGCMGVTRRSRWALMYTGANQCRLHGTPALLAKALCVHIPLFYTVRLAGHRGHCQRCQVSVATAICKIF